MPLIRLQDGRKGGINMDQKLLNILQEVKDPEIPTVSIVEMGMIHRAVCRNDMILVEIIPTFVGCPALDLIRENVLEMLRKKTDASKIEVQFCFDKPWTSDRITEEGRRKLKEFGIVPPMNQKAAIPPCPFCGADQGEVDNLFGPTACRAIYYCKKCRQPYEGMKNI